MEKRGIIFILIFLLVGSSLVLASTSVTSVDFNSGSGNEDSLKYSFGNSIKELSSWKDLKTSDKILSILGELTLILLLIFILKEIFNNVSFKEEKKTKKKRSSKKSRKNKKK